MSISPLNQVWNYNSEGLHKHLKYSNRAVNKSIINTAYTSATVVHPVVHVLHWIVHMCVEILPNDVKGYTAIHTNLYAHAHTHIWFGISNGWGYDRAWEGKQWQELYLQSVDHVITEIPTNTLLYSVQSYVIRLSVMQKGNNLLRRTVWYRDAWVAGSVVHKCVSDKWLFWRSQQWDNGDLGITIWTNRRIRAIQQCH